MAVGVAVAVKARSDDDGVVPVSRLLSDRNGLYYQPYLRELAAGPQDNADAARLRALLDVPGGLSALSSDDRAFFRSEAVDAAPLLGRAWLAQLEAGGAHGLLGRADIAPVTRMLSPGGWFSSGEESTTQERLASTLAAVTVLQAVDGLTRNDRDVVHRWIDSVTLEPDDWASRAAVVKIANLLHVPVPTAATTGLAAPQDTSVRTLSADRKRELLADLADFVVVAQAAGQAADVGADGWRQVLRANAADASYGQLVQLVEVLQFAGVTGDAFDPVRDRLRHDTLTDGAVRDASEYIGDLGTTYLVVMNAGPIPRAARGALADAVEAVAPYGQQHGDPTSAVIAQAALARLGRSRPATAAGLCASAAVIPEQLTADNAAAWAAAARACASLGATVKPPRTAEQWPVASAQEAFAAATAVVGYEEIGDSAGAARVVGAQALRTWALRPEEFPSLTHFLTIVRAYLELRGQRDTEVEQAVRAQLEQNRGCQDFPDLYSAVADSGCDLAATDAVVRISHTLDGIGASGVVPTMEDMWS